MERKAEMQRDRHVQMERGGGRTRQRQTVRETLAQESAKRHSERV